jgi:oligopeptide/dipeptide ABC transporter ATP-binding protein
VLYEVKDLTIDFMTPSGSLHAVRGVSLDLAEKEVLGIVGESGSGKSVTALSLLRLLPPRSTVIGGQILYKGRSVPEMGRTELLGHRGKGTGMIFQEPGRSFDPLYSIGKSFRELFLMHDPSLKKRPDLILEMSLKLLKEVHVPKAEGRLLNFPHQFSGGLLQRIMIGIALALDPAVLIADEPTTSLDVTIQKEIVDLLVELKEKRGLSIIFITHNLALISGIADRICVMYGGLVLEEGPSALILNSPYHPYTRALLDSLPSLGDHYRHKTLKTIPGTVPNPYRPEPGCPFAPRCSMAVGQCATAVPELLAAEDTLNGVKTRHKYRCIFPGIKT